MSKIKELTCIKKIILFSSVLFVVLDMINFRTINNNGIGFVEDLKNISLVNLNVELWSGIFTTLIAVMGTYYFTNKSNKGLNEEQQRRFNQERREEHERLEIEIQENDKKLRLDKEMQYRKMNKENIDVILREIKRFYGTVCYYKYLYEITENLNISSELFSSEFKWIIENNNKFLLKLKNDFYYDEEFVEMLNEAIYPSDKSVTGTDYIIKAKEIYMYFFSFDTETNLNFDFNKYREKAKKKLFEKCGMIYDDKLWLRERVLDHMNNTKNINFFTDEELDLLFKCSIKIKQYFSNLEVNNSTQKNLIEEIEDYKINVVPIFIEKYKVDSEDKVYNKFVAFFNGSYTYINGNIVLDDLGKNDEDVINEFVNNYKIDYFEDIPYTNYVVENREKYHYI